MPTLDINTLSLVALATSLMLPLVLMTSTQFISGHALVTRAMNRGSLLYAAGFLLLSLRGLLPDWLAFFVGNTMIIGGYAELTVGFRMYFRGHGSRIGVWLLLAASVPALYVYVVITPDVSARIFVTSLALLVISAALAYEFYAAVRRLATLREPGANAERRVLQGLTLVFALAALSFAWRAYAFWGQHGPVDPSTFSGRNWGIAFLVGVLLNLSLATSMPLLISRRNQRALLQNRALLDETERLAQVGSLVYAPEGPRTTPNRLMAQWVHGTDPRDMALDDFLSTLTPDVRREFSVQIEALLQGSTTSWTTECPMQSPNEPVPRWISVHCGSSRGPSGLRQVIITARDVTAFKQAAEAALAARKEADRANAAKSAFLANMSHEIRTPMNGVLGLTRLCLDGDLPARERELIAKCHSAAQSLLGIVNDILDFSKIEAGKLTVEHVPFDLERVLDNARNLFDETAGSKGLRFMMERSPEVPRGLVGDPLRLGQVLNNLLSNAVKFTSAGDIRLHIRPSPGAPAETADTVWLDIAVSDTGIGMSAEQQKRLFQPFSQADNSTTRKYGGSGLGLAISARLVTLMGGTLVLDSQPDRGSTFTVSLPFGKSEQALQHADTALVSAGQPLAGVRVLLVEDNPINVLVARLSLEKAGAWVHHCGDGQQAVDYLRDAPDAVDVVLMDIQMPVMDGYTATRTIRDTLGMVALPIIAMTANVLDADRQASHAAGMQAHIGKPFDMAQLSHAILTSLGSTVDTGSAAPTPALARAPAKPGPTSHSATAVDVQGALQRMGNNHALLAQAAGLFAKDLNATQDRLTLAATQQDWDAAQALLHTLKGLAGTLGMGELSQMAAKLEKSAKSSPAQLPLADLERLHALAQASIRELRQALDTPATNAPPPAPAHATTQAQTRQALTQLHALLVRSDMAALEHFASHRADLETAGWPRLAAIEEALQSLDFDLAAQACQQELEAK